ncbi:MAG: fusion protein [Rhodospirillaceae bacterium]|nr:fusion protein [Rhodospirillaceae bacterium]|tara:strand:+ start:25176 stop:25772 length:597 start_codon:yes stop_codon:yes gene_type:complete
MPRITPKSREELSDLEDVFERAEKALGFVPNSFFIMGRRPEMLRAFSLLSREVVGVPGRVSQELKWLIAHIASRSAGCQYCMAHTAGSANKAKNEMEAKIDAVFEYERSDLFSDAEKAALVVAQAAGTTPNMVSDEDMENLKKHFDEDQIVEIVGVICMFGWLNRFNDTMATDLEQEPLEFATEHLAASGWHIGKHAG